jgi:hypothetical protein
MQPTLSNQGKVKRARTKTATSCTHSRMVDEVRSPDGAKTGHLICLECQAQFPDPMCQLRD